MPQYNEAAIDGYSLDSFLCVGWLIDLVDLRLNNLYKFVQRVRGVTTVRELLLYHI